ncbi:MAG: hypothetical protein NT051_04265 [Candidatus Micrarchaeota archaeon]|nr:hypothetical protein [Candidatus Micrarchaeota archaeon]
MAGTDFDMILKKEAKSSLQVFKDQSLLRRKFGDIAVKLYNAIDSGKTASQIISDLGVDEEKFVEILEFMNNNAMVSISPSDDYSPQGISAKPIRGQEEAKEESSKQEEPPQSEDGNKGEEEGSDKGEAEREGVPPEESEGETEKDESESGGSEADGGETRSDAGAGGTKRQPPGGVSQLTSHCFPRLKKYCLTSTARWACASTT